MPGWLAPFLEPFAPNHSWRDLRTGAILYRCRQTLPLQQGSTNAAGTLMIDEDGLVRRFPPPPNWPLLALSQTVLALPLILLWLLLGFRRKKRALSVSDGSLPNATP